jgi:hypothetical protein
MKLASIIGLSILVLSSGSSVWATPPSVNVSCDAAQDAICAEKDHYLIEKQWKEELEQDLPQIRELWNSLGPKLLATTEELTGKEFSTREANIRLTLCNVPSESTGTDVKVNMRYALGTFTNDPVPLRYKVSIFYHELLHGFIDRNLPHQSALLAEHACEPERVWDHLHLLALEKAVYLHLGLKEQLAEIIKLDSEPPNGFYKRAWEIVNTNETTYLKFMAELKEHDSQWVTERNLTRRFS